MTTHIPQFSIIIPTYNRASSLSLTLSSLTKQTFTDFEVIITDDGSTDNTYDVIQKFKACLNIHYRKIANSGGPARPRNDAIARSSGRYIAFLDSDDIWLPTKLEVCLESLLTGCDFVYHDSFIHRNDVFFRSDKILQSHQLYSPVFNSLINNGNCIINSSVIVSRKLLYNALPIDESVDLIAAEDYDLWLRLSEYSNSFLHIPSSLMIYSLGSDNLSSYQRKYSFTRYLCLKYGFSLSDPMSLPLWALKNLSTTSYRLKYYSQSSFYSWFLLKRSCNLFQYINFLCLFIISRALSLLRP